MNIFKQTFQVVFFTMICWLPGSLLKCQVIPADNFHVSYAQTSKDASKITYRLSLNGVRTLKEGTLDLDKGKGRINGTLDQPGFLRCDITCTAGKDTLHAVCGCGFNVEEIRPAGKLPDNFDRFWREAKAELLRISIDARLEEVSVVDSGDAQRFKVSLANVNGSRVYGWLHLPEGNGPFPTVLSIPGSGVGRTGRFAGFTGRNSSSRYRNTRSGAEKT